MNASSEAARTSRVSAPIARPRAAKASADAASAASQSGKRPQSSSMNSPSPPSISRQTTTEQAAASAAFSTSKPVRDTSPRTSRAKAFSSRSSASVPAASSTVTNISETATASATANELSEVVPPSITCERTRIGSPTTDRTSSENDRLSRASSREVDHALDLGADTRDPAAARLRASRRICSDRSRPSTSKSWPRNE